MRGNTEPQNNRGAGGTDAPLDPISEWHTAVAIEVGIVFKYSKEGQDRTVEAQQAIATATGELFKALAGEHETLSLNLNRGDMAQLRDEYQKQARNQLRQELRAKINQLEGRE